MMMSKKGTPTRKAVLTMRGLLELVRSGLSSVIGAANQTEEKADPIVIRDADIPVLKRLGELHEKIDKYVKATPNIEKGLSELAKKLSVTEWESLDAGIENFLRENIITPINKEMIPTMLFDNTFLGFGDKNAKTQLSVKLFNQVVCVFENNLPLVRETREGEIKAVQEAKEREAKAAQEAKEREAKAAQEAREREAKAAQEAREREAKAAQEAREREAKLAQEIKEREAKLALEIKEREAKAAQEIAQAQSIEERMKAMEERLAKGTQEAVSQAKQEFKAQTESLSSDNTNLRNELEATKKRVEENRKQAELAARITVVLQSSGSEGAQFIQFLKSRDSGIDLTHLLPAPAAAAKNKPRYVFDPTQTQIEQWQAEITRAKSGVASAVSADTLHNYGKAKIKNATPSELRFNAVCHLDNYKTTKAPANSDPHHVDLVKIANFLIDYILMALVPTPMKWTDVCNKLQETFTAKVAEFKIPAEKSQALSNVLAEIRDFDLADQAPDRSKDEIVNILGTIYSHGQFVTKNESVIQYLKDIKNGQTPSIEKYLPIASAATNGLTHRSS